MVETIDFLLFIYDLSIAQKKMIFRFIVKSILKKRKRNNCILKSFLI